MEKDRARKIHEGSLKVWEKLERNSPASSFQESLSNSLPRPENLLKHAQRRKKEPFPQVLRTKNRILQSPNPQLPKSLQFQFPKLIANPNYPQHQNRTPRTPLSPPSQSTQPRASPLTREGVPRDNASERGVPGNRRRIWKLRESVRRGVPDGPLRAVLAVLGEQTRDIKLMI